MALVYRDCIKQTTTATDDNDLSLDSTEFQGYRTFDEALSDGDTCYYLLDEKVSGQWEIGLGTFTAPSLLERTTVYQSSNSNNKIDLYNGSYPEVSITTRAAIFQDFEDTINSGSVGTSLVAEYEVTGSAAATMPISGLDLNSDIGWHIDVSIVSATSSKTDIQLFVNADTTPTNYVSRYIYSSSSSIATGPVSASYIAAASGTTGNVSYSTIDFSIVNGYAAFIIKELRSNSEAAGVYFNKHNVSQSNITQLSVVANSGTPLGIGSKIKIYRWLV